MTSDDPDLCSFPFAGAHFSVVGQTALWWPQARALLVADLHFEKASWFAVRGQMLPPYDSMATLERLAGLAHTLDAAHIYCLGDNFHDDDGVERLPAAARAMLHELADRHGLHWIVGNHDPRLGHDPGLGARVPGPVSEELRIGDLLLRHEAGAFAQGGEVTGHYHPKARIRAAGRIIARPCFVRGQWRDSNGLSCARLILPAFGALTGGLDVASDAIAALFPRGYQALVPTRDKFVTFPFSVAESEEKAQLSLWQK